MAFKRIDFYNYRNIKNQSLNINAKNIVFIGKNAQGKTNLLESLYLLSFGSSFRSLKENDFINFNEKESSLIAFIEKKDETKIQIKFLNNKKNILIDHQTIKDRKELLNYFPVVVFKHDDILLISGTPEVRRNFMDQVIALCNFTYIDELRKYKKLLKHRNAILKTANLDYIDIIDEQLVQLGKEIIKKRISITEEFNKTFNDTFNQIMGSQLNLKLVYNSSWGDDPITKLKNSLERDLFNKTTTSGPHRDQYYILDGEFDFSKVASTGQRRILALLLKINKAILVSKKRKEKPILLFDDVLLELDLIKKQKILQFLPDYEQAFWTFLPEENYKEFNLENVKVYSVEDGGCL